MVKLKVFILELAMSILESLKEKLGRLKRSFWHALGGLWYALRRELNLQIELLAGILVVITMLILPIQKWEGVVLVIMITWVLVLEVLNTLLERLVNLLKPRIHPYVGTLKDLMAAAVFLSAAGAAVVGLIIFWPYLL